jgi:hypothetical protein
MAVAWAASAATLCSARMGRLGDVEPMAERASAVEHPGLLRFTTGLGQITSLLMAGDVAQAQELAQRFTDFAELQQPGRAVGEVLLAYVLLTKGEFGPAASMLEPAAATLERTGYSWGPLSLMLLASAQAQLGNIPASAKALRRAETRHGTKSAMFAPELGIARAWTRAAARDRTGARAAARGAAPRAERARTRFPAGRRDRLRGRHYRRQPCSRADQPRRRGTGGGVRTAGGGRDAGGGRGRGRAGTPDCARTVTRLCWRSDYYASLFPV